MEDVIRFTSKEVAVDLMHFLKSGLQNKYLVVFEDLLTKWIELKAISSATGKEIAAAFEELILLHIFYPITTLR